ncbi:MAG: hypothetical protein HQL32_17090 [Planctomycetes bacterium]|nr:hypothetical protein [Planctomycetota bacterium]
MPINLPNKSKESWQQYISQSQAKDRRGELIHAMEANESAGYDCMECKGCCCTFANNTMHVTPTEALDLFADLVKKNWLTKAMRQRLQECISHHGLDRGDYYPGSNKRIRRGYTCPFFQYDNWGCAINRYHKPYGCIAFNPREKNQEEGKNCSSSQDKLLDHEAHWSDFEIYLNEQIQNEFGLHWQKTDIPRALLDIWDK